MSSPIRIVGIETSCDETAIGVVEDGKRVMANVVASSLEHHRPYGGVIPEIAARAHVETIWDVFAQALEQAHLVPEAIDAVAVTQGPGLPGALLIGVAFAKGLALSLDRPLIPVDHLSAHLYAGEMTAPELSTPYIGLVVSGGHTLLCVAHADCRYELLGETKDDAVGEAFDKVARMLELSYPGGPEISKLAESARSNLNASSQGSTLKFKLPRPMSNSDTCDFSFAGLKTAVLYLLKNNPKINDEEKKHIAHEFENAVADVLWKKTSRAIEQTDAQTLVIGGGVSANTHIRRIFAENMKKEYSSVALRIPSAALTTDNAIMIALAGFYRARRNDFTEPDALSANGNRSLA